MIIRKVLNHLAVQSWIPGLLFTLYTATAPAQTIGGPYSVQEDGSLRVDGLTVHLFGIYIPPAARACRPFEQPIACGSHLAETLNTKVGSDFIYCETKWENTDGSVVGTCRARDDDLAAHLLEQGWALALPDSPFEYLALERIAKRKGVGAWDVSGGVHER